MAEHVNAFMFSKGLKQRRCRATYEARIEHGYRSGILAIADIDTS
jgi:hypothetical protein